MEVKIIIKSKPRTKNVARIGFYDMASLNGFKLENILIKNKLQLYEIRFNVDGKLNFAFKQSDDSGLYNIQGDYSGDIIKDIESMLKTIKSYGWADLDFQSIQKWVNLYNPSNNNDFEYLILKWL